MAAGGRWLLAAAGCSQCCSEAVQSVAVAKWLWLNTGTAHRPEAARQDNPAYSLGLLTLADEQATGYRPVRARTRIRTRILYR